MNDQEGQKPDIREGHQSKLYIYKNYFIHPVHRIAILINHHKKQLMTHIS